MKNLILTAALLLVASITFGQQKANLVGIHALTITLDPDVTMNQFKAFVIDKWIPEFEKNTEGLKLFLLKGIRGENNNSLGLLYVFESEEARNKYFNDDGSPSELGKSGNEKMEPVNKELEKLGTFTSKYTDWIIQ